MVHATFSIDPELELHWNLDGAKIKPMRKVYKVIREGLKAILNIQKTIKDIYGKISVVFEGNELKDINYLPLSEKGLIISSFYIAFCSQTNSLN